MPNSQEKEPTRGSAADRGVRPTMRPTFHFHVAHHATIGLQMKPYVVLLVLCAGLQGAAPDWKAGVASVVITPRKSIWMAGYSARKRPSEGALQDLYAKALALQDRKGERFVLVTTDLLGLTATVSENVAERARKKYGLGRERLM